MVRFWSDRWSPLLSPLDHIFAVLADQAHVCVANYVTLSGEWNWDMLKHLLLQDVLLHIAAILPPQQNQDDDFILWNVSSSGKFSIKSAYKSLNPTPTLSMDAKWLKVWLWSGPQKICMFLWLAMHDNLLTAED